MTSEWDGTAWAGQSIVTSSNLPVLQAHKAVSGPGVVSMTTLPYLSTLQNDPQRRAAMYLQAYRVGWFYKAEHKISQDIATLEWSVSLGDDVEGDNQETLDRPDLDTPFESLSPIDQFQRLMERPNPRQTGRQFREKLQIRLDMVGWTFIYLDGIGAASGLPTALWGISPSRMTPAYDRDGNQIGWVMDNGSQNPVPFDLDEILLISYGTPDDGPYGVGVVEAVNAHLPMTDLLIGHTADVLRTGGRLAGMVWPKDRALAEDEFQDVVRSWRSVASDPNAARRLLVFPEPMEWQSGAATPAEIGIPELAALTRDEILTAFPISPYMLGVPMPGGLTSAEVRREERKTYWSDTIHPRVEVLEEAIQVGLLSRYEKLLGQSYDFDFEEPNLDDAQVLIEKVGAFRALINAGFDGEAAREAAGLDQIEWTGIPTAPPIPVQNDATGGLTVVAQDTTPRDPSTSTQNVAKALKAARDTATDPIVASTRSDMARFLAEQRDRIAENVRKTLPTAKADRLVSLKSDPKWWDGTSEDAALALTLRQTYTDVGRAGLQTVADRLERLVGKGFIQNVLADLYDYGLTRVTAINAVTKAAVADVIAEGIRRGYGIAQIVDGVPRESFPGVRGAVMGNGSGAWDELRAETVARTETMLAYNRATLDGYGEFGVRTVLAYDGDQDDECAARDGHEFPLDEALGIEDHPNGTLDWAPVL